MEVCYTLEANVKTARQIRRRSSADLDRKGDVKYEEETGSAAGARTRRNDDPGMLKEAGRSGTRSGGRRACTRTVGAGRTGRTRRTEGSDSGESESAYRRTGFV